MIRSVNEYMRDAGYIAGSEEYGQIMDIAADAGVRGGNISTAYTEFVCDVAIWAGRNKNAVREKINRGADPAKIIDDTSNRVLNDVAASWYLDARRRNGDISRRMKALDYIDTLIGGNGLASTLESAIRDYFTFMLQG